MDKYSRKTGMKWPWCLGSAAVFFVVINALRVCVKTHMPYGHLSETSTDTDKTCPTTSPTDAINRITLRYNDMSQPFDVSAQVAGSLTPPSASFMTLTSDKMADFVFVTAASENHFLESMDAIASVQSVMPTKQIMYFDLGLTDNQVAEVQPLRMPI
ncbi:hypothetical protein LSAT2_012899 [Lamellibrachia satsuma]|nr:hypothetical protein LSAT2_012899 [Lamellibrachia satsuma]